MKKKTILIFPKHQKFDTFACAWFGCGCVEGGISLESEMSDRIGVCSRSVLFLETECMYDNTCTQYTQYTQLEVGNERVR